MAAGKKNSETTESPKAGAGETTPGFPLFYTDPQAMSVERHGAKAIAADANYSFARGTNSLPVTKGDS